MSLTDDFLNAYKKLETALRNSAREYRVLDYEQLIPEDRSNRLRLCRNVRNFLQHQYDGESFIQPTKAMLDFLNDELEIVNGKPVPERKPVNIVEPLLDTLTLGEIAKILSTGKRVWYPVVNSYNKPRGIIDYDLYEYYVQIQRKTLDSKLCDILPRKCIVPIVKSDKSKVYERAIIVNNEGKYAGIIEK